MNKQIQETVGVFCRFANIRLAKLQHGAELRIEMHRSLQQGRRPGGYRADWLKKSSTTLMAVLGKIAEEFDKEHPDDKASLADLMDITATTMGMLKKENGDDDEDEDCECEECGMPMDDEEY